MHEFELIQHYFSAIGTSSSRVKLGVGDDAAIVGGNDDDLLVCSDTMVEGVHFSPQTAPSDIGYKLLTVNLSDMAAMGGDPSWCLLNLTLPEVDRSWISSFAEGLNEAAKQFGVQLIGGDTTRGPLCLSLQLGGYVPKQSALVRSGASAGDQLFVSGPIGDAYLGLVSTRHSIGLTQDALDKAHKALNRPTPQVTLGMALRGIATSCIDISDGLLADLEHVLAASGGLGARINADTVPLSIAGRQWLQNGGELQQLFSGGEDYELCFTAPASHAKKIDQLYCWTDNVCTAIGCIEETPGIRVLDNAGKTLTSIEFGYQHF
ncbi:MAG: thiamine-monophosphate kinase [Parasphingorhabdus sp.]|jgi:thiamine-monophosphate kinase